MDDATKTVSDNVNDSTKTVSNDTRDSVKDVSDNVGDKTLSSDEYAEYLKLKEAAKK